MTAAVPADAAEPFQQVIALATLAQDAPLDARHMLIEMRHEGASTLRLTWAAVRLLAMCAEDFARITERDPAAWLAAKGERLAVGLADADGT